MLYELHCVSLKDFSIFIFRVSYAEQPRLFAFIFNTSVEILTFSIFISNSNRAWSEYSRLPSYSCIISNVSIKSIPFVDVINKSGSDIHLCFFRKDNLDLKCLFRNSKLFIIAKFVSSHNCSIRLPFVFTSSQPL